MSKYPNVSRREALKQIGAVAIGAGLGIGGLSAAEVLNPAIREYKGRQMGLEYPEREQRIQTNFI